jgi:hypothetical protein
MTVWNDITLRQVADCPDDKYSEIAKKLARWLLEARDAGRIVDQKLRDANLQVEVFRRVLGLVRQAAHQEEWYDSMGIQQDAWVAVNEALAMKDE